MSCSIEIPNKSQFRMSEVCGLTGVKSYVLRFWESEFDQIDPIVSSSGQKLYEHKDIEAIMQIKKLLFDDKMTVEAARAGMKESFSELDIVSLVDAVSQDKDDSCTEAVFTDGHIQKLVLAKAKLNSLISFADSINNS